MSTFGTLYYNYWGLHDYMIRVVCWSFSPSLPSLEARNDTKPSHESSLVRAGGFQTQQFSYYITFRKLSLFLL